MKGNNFLWAVKQMHKKKKVKRLEGFGSSGCEYLEMEDGFIYYYSKKRKEIRNVCLQYWDYLAEDWVLL